jgi:hypothetical protein
MYQPWKFLIYMGADNVLYDNAQICLREIVDASLFSDLDMTVQIDGPTAAMATRYQCEKGSKRLIWEAPEYYTADRGDRLRDFLDAAAVTCNSHQRILLVLWGEGSGLDSVYFYGDLHDRRMADNPLNPLLEAGEDPHRLFKAMQAVQTMQGVPDDVLNGQNANLYVKNMELGAILLEFSKKIGRRIDILGFDACLMAMAEICYEVRESVSMVVGSDERVPKESWPYAWILRELARFPGMNASTLSTLIVGRYIERYKNERVSLSTMNLSDSEELAWAWSRLVEAFGAVAHNVALKRRIFRARDASRNADQASYIDLGAFCQELMESFEERTPVHAAAKLVLFILKNQSYVQYHRSVGQEGTLNPYGLSIYFPAALPPHAEGLEEATTEFRVATHAALSGHKDPPHQHKDPGSGMKDPPHQHKDPGSGRKDPPHQSKDPGSGMKDPPHQHKDPGGGMKDPPHQHKDPGSGMKDPPHQHKDPGSGRKDPPHQHKDPGGAGASGMAITSYYILWDSYVPLAFNKATGWADFLARVLADDSYQTGAGR